MSMNEWINLNSIQVVFNHDLELFIVIQFNAIYVWISLNN